MTTVASGRCTSEPAEVAIAIGTNPSEATSPVRNTGRSRCGVPRVRIRLVVIAYLFRLRSSLKWFKAMKPTPAEMLNGSPRSQRATIPPISDSGTVENTINV